MSRTGRVERQTSESKVLVEVDLDRVGRGRDAVSQHLLDGRILFGRAHMEDPAMCQQRTVDQSVGRLAEEPEAGRADGAGRGRPQVLQQ